MIILEHIEFYINYHYSLTIFETGDRAILMCAAFSFALKYGGKSLYMFLSQLVVKLMMHIF